MAAEKKPKPLSQQHQRFVAAYRRLRNATRAYMEVYPRASHATADSHGPTLLSDGRISSEIKRLDNEVLKRQHMDADEALAHAASVARANVADLYWKPGELDASGVPIEPRRVGARKMLHEMPPEVQRCIKSIEQTEHGVKITLWSKDVQLTNVLKHHKLIGADVNVNITIGFAERLRAAREKRLGDAK